MKMTAEQLKRFALQHGAKIQIGDKVFNAEMAKADVKPSQVTVEKVAEPPPDKNTLLMAEAVTFMVKSMDTQNRRIAAALLKPAPEAAPATTRGAWKFAIKRDRNDMITEIIATPAEN